MSVVAQQVLSTLDHSFAKHVLQDALIVLTASHATTAELEIISTLLPQLAKLALQV